MVIAGSLGRSTSVSGNFDVDVHVFVRDQRRQLTLEDWRDDRGGVRTKARNQVYRALRSKQDEGFQLPGLEEGDVVKMTIGGRAVDLLILPDVSPQVPGGYPTPEAWARAQLKATMQPVYDNPSAAVFCHWREKAASGAFKELMRAQPSEVTLVTQLLKAWRDDLDAGRVLGGKTGVTSVVLEVVVLAAHQKLRMALRRRYERYDVCTVQLFAEALRLLDAAVEEGEVITVDAGEWGPPPPLSPLDYRHCWEADPVKIIHPIDPTYNLARPRKGKRRPKWAAAAKLARHVRALFLGGGSLKDVLVDSFLELALLTAAARYYSFAKNTRATDDGEELALLERLGAGHKSASRWPPSAFPCLTRFHEIAWRAFSPSLFKGFLAAQVREAKMAWRRRNGQVHRGRAHRGHQVSDVRFSRFVRYRYARPQVRSAEEARPRRSPFALVTL
ncbi:hypothetical protein HYH03_016442 [Edaphochlamys debaryana]|uniref:Uncharacterized protein n=1 Tax=Edaphochlamys debaryana TaxID=47281 RepID=A0A835XRM6_9CHLO|nr:hypothetical protein HYH03_016442 [Edaphochlamys debaryana]|eukprot:KAG2484789.1 hypothetical protein HYH03_016442 [Edaphochlamys debaryana]